MTMQIEVTTFSERTPLKVSFSLSRSVVIPAVVEEGLVTGYAEVIELPFSGFFKRRFQNATKLSDKVSFTIKCTAK